MLGVTTLAVCLLVVAAAVAVWAMRRSRGLTGMAAAGAAIAILAGTLGVLEMDRSSPAAGVPVLADLKFGSATVPVAVVPGRPGWNLVHVDATNAAVGFNVYHMTPATPRPATTGVWSRVKLPSGNASLLIQHGGSSATVQLRTGSDATADPALTGPDGPECVSAVLGALIAGRQAPVRECPSQRLSSADSAALRGMIGFIAARTMKHITLVSDSSPRSRQAVKVILDACHADHVAVGTPRDHPGGPVIIVSGWAGADSALNQVADGHVPSEGTYLGPWLLNEPLLEYPAAQVIPLRFDLQSPAAFSYMQTLSARFPGEAPTDSGYMAWIDAKGASGDLVGNAKLYAASTVYMPGESGHNDGPQYQWFPVGGINQVSGALSN